MRSLSAIGTIALLSSGMLFANEMDVISQASFTSRMSDLPNLLSQIYSGTQKLIDSDDDAQLSAYQELKESLLMVYALNCLHPVETGATEKVLEECYIALLGAADTTTEHSHFIEHSLILFTSGDFYEQEALAAQSLYNWVDDDAPEGLRCVINTTDADIVYIQDSVWQSIQKDSSKPLVLMPHLLYRKQRLQDYSPKILVITNDKDSPDYKVEVGRTWHLGGKDHGKSTGYIQGEVKDKNGNYASGKITKEKDDDAGYTCDMKAGTEKQHKEKQSN